jgi:Flp pilus assembly protein TadD
MKTRISAFLPLIGTLGLSLALAGCAQPRDVSISPLQKSSQAGDTDQKLADTAQLSGNFDMAITLYKKILSHTPDSQPALLGLGNALYQTNQLQDARTIFEQVETRTPNQADAEMGLARIDVRKHQFDDAIRHYQGILRSAPDNLWALAGLGVTYDLQNRFTEAQATYRKALKTHPDDLNLHNDLGLSLILSHQVRAGIAELMQIVDDPGAPPQTRQNLALAYGLLGNDAAAQRVLQSGDLPPAAVQNNLKYYQVLRDRLATQTDPHP